MGDLIPLEQNPAKRKRGRPPNVDPREVVLPCKVGPKASKRQRQTAFLEEFSRTNSFRRSIAAAGVSLEAANTWTQDPKFQERVESAQYLFAEMVAEEYVDIAFNRTGRTPRARLSAIEGILRTVHPAFSRSRQEAAMRAHAQLTDHVIGILKELVDADTLKTVQEQFERMSILLESSGGTSFK